MPRPLLHDAVAFRTRTVGWSESGPQCSRSSIFLALGWISWSLDRDVASTNEATLVRYGAIVAALAIRAAALRKLRRYVCLLRAIAHDSATEAGCTRLDSQMRERCEMASDAMSSNKDSFVIGLVGGYGDVCSEFMRYFDVLDHDPARTANTV